MILSLKQRDADRDSRMSAVKLVRTGYAHILFRDLFPSDWPRPVIANTIDVVASDVAEQVGVLPTFSASGDSVIEDSSRKKADRSTKILNWYVWASRLGSHLTQGADRFSTYGFLPVRVEPNYDEKRPHITLDDPIGAYYDRDRWNTVSGYTKIFTRKSSELAHLFPEYAGYFLSDNAMMRGEKDTIVEVARWHDKDSTQLVVLNGENRGLVLSEIANPLSRVPVAVAQRPTVDGAARGSFDDVLWVFAARAKLALLSLDATQKAVEAPIALPQDVQEIAFGPDSILRSSTPEKIRRVGLDLPQSALIENQMLDAEIKFGSRYPNERNGSTDASVVTGRGVQALMSGFDARVKTSQMIIGEALADALSMALEMDEKLWPNETKEISSVTNGTPYQMRYTPAKDIKGSYAVNYEYGVMAGLDPNRALVWGLQGLGAGLFSKSFMRRNLPINMDVAQEEQIIDIEKLRDVALQAAEAYAQSIPGIAAQGGDPSQAIRTLGLLIDARKKGTPIEKAISTAFAPPEPPASAVSPAQEAAQPQDPMSGPEQPPAGGSLPQSPQAQPSMMQLLSQLGGDGRSSTSVRSMRQQAI
jgi:hypothetical protein